MLKTLMKNSVLVLVSLMGAATVCAHEAPKKTTQVTLNGTLMSAYFNDGDTFKILDGSMKNTRVRIEGYNTLETYGPVHEWKGNDTSYLYGLSKEATSHVEMGQWNCKTNNKKDRYGRMLATCDDLALSLISAGLAHAYSVDAEPANRKYITAQRKAKNAKLGIWKHGVPEFIISSLHSADEGAQQPYNRLVSTLDGHSKKWAHKKSYDICQKICLDDEASCMVYVPFTQRYGSERPDCLRQQRSKTSPANG